MGYLDALLLGLLQGLTEFLPVSSSGHLVLAQAALGVNEPGASLEIAVHLGTLAAVLAHYRRDVRHVLAGLVAGGSGRRLGLLVLLATLPAVALALLFGKQIESALESPRVACAGLMLTGVVLLLTPLARRKDREPGSAYAIIVGCAQAIAILPGISRSGSTISAALFLGDEPVRAARFSFLLSIPAILGAAVLTVASHGLPATDDAGPLALATAVAFASGWAAIVLLLRVLERGRLAAFGPYCIAVGVVGWFLVA